LIVLRCAGRELSEMISFPYLKEEGVGEKRRRGGREVYMYADAVSRKAEDR